MSLLPYVLGDPFFDFPRPSRILNQHFGMELDPEDLMAPLTLSRPLRCPLGYYRPWHTLAAQRDTGSTINVDKDKFQINLDVQHFAPNEITVKATGDNTITVEGKHEEKPDEHGFISRQFVRRYVLPKGHDINKVVSNLSSDGVLTITAPKTGGEAIESRSIPIQQTGQPSKPVENKQQDEKKEEKK